MSQCETCAYGNSGAAKEVKNRLVSLICANSGLPFFCHHSRSGEEWDWKSDLLGFMRLPANERKVCEGWKAAIRARVAKGYFHTGQTPDDQHVLRRYQRGLGNQALLALDAFLAEKSPEEKEEVRRELVSLIEAITPVRRTE